MLNDLHGKVVLITGGTRGIGLATGLAFGAVGAHCILTHRWGSADEDEIRARFAAAAAPVPFIVEADVANDGDTDTLMDAIRERHDKVDVFVSNAAIAPMVKGLEDYVKRDFLRCIEYSTWPMVAYTNKIRSTFGAYPRYVVGISSTGHLRYTGDYDAVAFAKSAMETLCRYMAYRLGPQGVSVNIVRPSYVDTEALVVVVGEGFTEFVKAAAPNAIVPVEEVSGAVLALCSGLLDGVNGQVIQVDRGALFSDSIVRQFEQAKSRQD